MQFIANTTKQTLNQRSLQRGCTWLVHTVTVSSERTDKRGRKLKTNNIGTKAKLEKGRRADGSIDRRTSSARGGSGDQSVPEVHGNSSGEFVTFKPAASLKECLAALAAEYGGMKVLALAVLDQCSPTELTYSPT